MCKIMLSSMLFRVGDNVATKSTQTEPQLYDQTSCSVEELSAQLSSLSHQIPSSTATSAGPVSSDVAQIPAAGSSQHVANRCPRDYDGGGEPTVAGAMAVPCRPKPYLPHVVLAGIAVRNLDPDNCAGRLYCWPLSLSVSNRCLDSYSSIYTLRFSWSPVPALISMFFKPSLQCCGSAWFQCGSG
jgi:hypothetical protein